MQYVKFPRDKAVWHVLTGTTRYSVATACGRTGPQEDAIRYRRAKIVTERPADEDRWCPLCKKWAAPAA